MTPSTPRSTAVEVVVWTAEMPIDSPPARSGGSMAYDAESRAFVLFGGTDVAASSFAPGPRMVRHGPPLRRRQVPPDAGASTSRTKLGREDWSCWAGSACTQRSASIPGRGMADLATSRWRRSAATTREVGPDRRPVRSAGLLRRERDAADRRSVHAVPVVAGEAAFDLARAVRLASIQRHCTGHVDMTGLRELCRFAARVIEARGAPPASDSASGRCPWKETR